MESDTFAVAPSEAGAPPAVAVVDGEKSPFYIAAPSAQADEHTLVLKQGDTFAVFDRFGDIKPGGLGEEGIYHDGTRFLSCLALTLVNARPLLLSSTIKEENDLLAVDITNPDLVRNGQVAVRRGTLHIARTKFLWEGVCYERFRLRNYGLEPLQFAWRLHFDADFADIFEVRGTRRKQKGKRLPSQVTGNMAVLRYDGLDGVARRTRLEFSPAPTSLAALDASYSVSLEPQGEAVFDLTVVCEPADRTPGLISHLSPKRERGSPAPPLAGASGYDRTITRVEKSIETTLCQYCGIHTSNDQFNAWVNRAVADLHMMITETPVGPYPYAGVPWFSTPFGRDGLITALECLWLGPGLARGVLAYLAATQADELDAENDAEPGKILHETRGGEMAALGEIPFGRYYGSIDATPLFVLLASAYYQRTGDRAFIESIWPNVERALDWMDNYGDPDKDGFIEYQRHSATGLVQQGWKDSYDSISHADGSLAGAPIALCEVQGYAYAARRGAAELALVVGENRKATELMQQAGALRQQFERAFWCDDLSTFAIALDGEKRPCRVRSSNPGHCLLTEIVSRELAPRLASTLLGSDSFSGWGIRTLASSEVRYNPMAYHNGSIWPHDNTLIAMGLARYGLKDSAIKVMTGLFRASDFMDLHRLPELFCGFTRRPGEGPTLYPVACAPQAWSAACVFALLQACLGLEVRNTEPEICFNYPVLPSFLREVKITNLQVGTASVDLLLIRHGNDVGINVLRRDGRVEIRMVK